MKGLPNDIELGFLSGCELGQICFNLNQLFLKFDNDVELSIESVCAIRWPAGEQLQIDDSFRKEATHICELLGRQVSRARRAADGGLIVEFEGGVVLEVFNSHVRYESFQLRRGRDLYVA